MSKSDTTDNYGATICQNCDPVRPGRVGNVVDERCPECGARMYGLTGTEASNQTQTTINTGDRVKLSEFGRSQLIRTSPNCHGTVLRTMYDGRLVIAWDGKAVKSEGYLSSLLMLVKEPSNDE